MGPWESAPAHIWKLRSGCERYFTYQREARPEHPGPGHSRCS
jgi:hypothetical protein